MESVQPRLTVTFRGIVSLVREPCDTANGDPGDWEEWRKGWILVPNANDRLDIGLPDAVHTRHVARLLVLEGHPCGSQWKSMRRCPTKDFEKDQYPGLRLRKKHVEIASGIERKKLKVDKGNVEKLPDLKDLVALVRTVDGEKLGDLPADVFESAYKGRRLLSRFLLENGELSATTLEPLGEAEFQLKDTFTGQWRAKVKKLGTSIVLTVPLCTRVEPPSLTLCVRDLSNPNKAERLEIRANRGSKNISILVENAPATSNGINGCRNGESHFAYHYVLRPGYEKAVGVLVPELEQRLQGSNDNAQCSPVRDSGS